MDAITQINPQALIRLKAYRDRLTPQQYRTLRGQMLKGDTEGALRGLKKLLERRAKGETATRYTAGRSSGQQPKD